MNDGGKIADRVAASIQHNDADERLTQSATLYRDCPTSRGNKNADSGSKMIKNSSKQRCRNDQGYQYIWNARSCRAETMRHAIYLGDRNAMRRRANTAFTTHRRKTMIHHPIVEPSVRTDDKNSAANDDGDGE